MKRRARTGPAVAVVWLATAGALVAQNNNLISNAEFHQDVDGWTWLQVSTGFEWNAFDWTECGPLSGSAMLTNSSGIDSGSAWARICVPAVVAGATYSFGGYLRFPAGQTNDGRANVSAQWMSDPDCTGSLVGIDGPVTYVHSSTAGSWVWSGIDESVAPASAQSVLFEAFLVKNQSSGTLDLRVDGVYFVAARGFLFRDGFGLESTCRWSAEQL